MKNIPIENKKFLEFLELLLILQKENSSDEWSPFSTDDYKNYILKKEGKQASRNQKRKFRKALKAMIQGGRPFGDQKFNIDAGWILIIKHRYHFSGKFLQIIEVYSHQQAS